MVSVAVCVRNVEKYIGDCLTAILNQSMNDFELIIVDDLSCDRTKEIIEQFSDKRIRYYQNSQIAGISKSRNQCLAYAKCNYVFFTDADCKVSRTWIEEGLKLLKAPDIVGVEGKTIYVSENYIPTRSDAVMENKFGGYFLTCNIAYKKNVLEKIGRFDEKFFYLEDRDIAFRAIKQGKILFNTKMLVYHQKKNFTPTQFIQTGRRLRNRVLLFKKYGDRPQHLFFGRIAYPTDLLKIMCPALLFGSLVSNKYKKREDFILFPLLYIRLIYERLNLWDMCAKQRVFLI